MKNNPFFENFDTPFETIPFSKIKTELFIPAIDKAIEIGKENIEAIVNNQNSAGFDNTIEQFEIASELLGMISGVYWHLFGSHGSPDLKKLADVKSINCKSRSVQFKNYYTESNSGFVHVEINILEGRTTEIKKQIGEETLKLLKAC